MGCLSAVAIRDTAIQLSSPAQQLKTNAVVKEKPQSDKRDSWTVENKVYFDSKSNKSPFNKGVNKKWSTNHKTDSSSSDQTSRKMTRRQNPVVIAVISICPKIARTIQGVYIAGRRVMSHVYEDCYQRKFKQVATGNIYITTFTAGIGSPVTVSQIS
jgi:hypothetical protein